MLKHFYDNKLIPLSIFLVALLTSLLSLACKSEILYLYNKHFDHIWLPIVLTPLITSILIFLIYCFKIDINWNDNKFIKMILIIINYLYLTTLFFMTIPVVLTNNTEWILTFEILITIINITIITLTKNAKKALIIKWVSILLLTLIPAIAFQVVGMETLRNVVLVFFAWEFIIDTFVVQKIFVGEKYSDTIFNRYPLVANSSIIFCVVNISFIIFWPYFYKIKSRE